jgi:uncharacterized OB-fold protein
MSFKSCRKCGYKFVPLDYDHCPKCQAPASRAFASRKALLFAAVAAFAIGALYAALSVLPRISISIQ